MNGTKLGISVGLISAIAFFAGYVGMIPVILMLAIVLYADVDVTAKKNVAQAAMLSIFFSLIGIVLSACSGVYVDFTGLFVEAYKVYEVLSKLNLFSWLIKLLDVAEFGFMIYAFFAAFKGNVVKLPVTKLVEKHFDE